VEIHQKRRQEAMIKTGLEELIIGKAGNEEIEAEVRASIEVMELCLGRMESVISAGQEEIGAEIETGLDETKAEDLKANQEKIRGHSRTLQMGTLHRSYTRMGFHCSAWNP
jgi:hypothetical protein